MKKRILAFVLAAVTALSLVACGGSDTKEKPQIKTRESITYFTSDSGEYKSGDVSYRSIIEYDKDGNIISQEISQEKLGGYTEKTKTETEWIKSDNVLKGTYSDGTYVECKLDKNGNVEMKTTYDSEGAVVGVQEYEYKDGILVASKETTKHGEDEIIWKYELNEKGNPTYVMCEISKEKNLEREYENIYDEDGKLTSVYVTDILNHIDYVDTYEYDANGYLKRKISGDGDTRTDYECDENGNIIEERTYNGAGKLHEQVITTYYED